MNREDIIRMAREAGLAFDSEEYPEIWQTYMYVGREEIERFAALVASAEHKRVQQVYTDAATDSVKAAIAYEREACAKLCDGWTHADGDQCAEAIRARGDKND